MLAGLIAWMTEETNLVGEEEEEEEEEAVKGGGLEFFRYPLEH